MLYEMELRPDGSFECLTFVGLETLIGPVPNGMSSEEAYDAAVHPEDREVYDRATDGLWRKEPVEVEYRLLGADGEVRWVLDRMRPERQQEDGSLLVSGVVADISSRKQIEAEAMGKLAHAALHDSLTGLSNRASFLEHLELGLKRAARTGTGVGVLFIDLDNFKLVNDSFGHSAGDELLKAVGSRLQSAVRGMDVVARQGGDEFLILLTDLESQTDRTIAAPRAAEVVASKVRTNLREPFLVEGIEIFLSASIGISLSPADGDDAETLLKHADVAMYSVKDSGRDGYARYRDGADNALEQISKAARLRKSVESGRGLVLHYQPLLNLETVEVVGVEALVRWQDGSRGLVQPDDFGTGGSSVGRLNRNGVHMLKIDRSFVQELTESEHARKLVASVIQLAQTLGLEPLAEGVETEDQRRFLVEHGCRYGQGFLFSRPLPKDQVKAFYEGEQPSGRRVA